MAQADGSAVCAVRSSVVVGLAAAAAATAAAVAAYRHREALFAWVVHKNGDGEPPLTTDVPEDGCLDTASHVISPQIIGMPSFWPDIFNLRRCTTDQASIFSAWGFVLAKPQEVESAPGAHDEAEEQWPFESGLDGDQSGSRRCDDSDIDSAMSGDERIELEGEKMLSAIEGEERLSALEGDKVLFSMEGEKTVIPIPEEFSFESDPVCIQCESPKMLRSCGSPLEEAPPPIITAHESIQAPACAMAEVSASMELQSTKTASKPNLLRRSLQRLSHKITRHQPREADGDEVQSTSKQQHLAKKATTTKKKPFSAVKSALKKLKTGIHPPSATSQPRLSAC